MHVLCCTNAQVAYLVISITDLEGGLVLEDLDYMRHLSGNS